MKGVTLVRVLSSSDGSTLFHYCRHQCPCRKLWPCSRHVLCQRCHCRCITIRVCKHVFFVIRSTTALRAIYIGEYLCNRGHKVCFCSKVARLRTTGRQLQRCRWRKLVERRSEATSFLSSKNPGGHPNAVDTVKIEIIGMTPRRIFLNIQNSKRIYD